MWSDFDGTAYTREEFAARVATLHWNQGWRPLGICLHNTAAPTLKQWDESGAKHAARISNLQHFYEKEKGWHSGPHMFVSRSYITMFSNILKAGVHSRCFNATHIGIEMVGDYATEPFDSGDGALVRDNAVFAMAVLYKALGLSPNGLVFHKECKLDNHDCPGKLVNKSDVIGRVVRAMGALEGSGVEPSKVVEFKPGQPAGDPLVRDAQRQLTDLMYSPGPIDGVDGPQTQKALQAFKINNAALLELIVKGTQ